MKYTGRFWGITVSALGAGILLALFLPEGVLVVIEALVIILAGILFLRS